MQSEELYARLELLNPAQAQSRQTRQPASAIASVVAKCHGWSQTLERYFIGSQEPRIATRRHNGQTVYKVYDPVDRRHHTFSSELAVRVWLEERYYQ